MKKFIPLILFSFLAVFLYIGLGKDTKKLPSPLINKPFPVLQVNDFQTQQAFLIQTRLKGRVSLVNVWASWCVTCKAEHPVLTKIAKTKTVQMVGINYKDTREEGNNFLLKLSNPYDWIVFDAQGKLGLELGVYAVPETFLVDKQGIIRYKLIGELTSEIWNDKIYPMLQSLQ
jgi:cytochrome c biogenesis protein CcmG/thiol:disulfide interchange protein DsbE